MQPTEQNRLFGQRVISIRLTASLSQTELAARLGDILGKKVDPTTITRMEKGTRPTSVVEIYALAEVFGVSIHDLMPSERATRRAYFQYRTRLRSLELEAWHARQQVAALEREHERLTAARDAAERLGDTSLSGRPLKDRDFADLEQIAKLGTQLDLPVGFSDVFIEFLPYSTMYRMAEHWAMDRLGMDHANERPFSDVCAAMVGYLRDGQAEADRIKLEQSQG